MDERYDMQRSVTDGRFVYVRNYMPHLPAGQHVEYMFQTKTTKVWRKLFDEGKLVAPQTLFWLAHPGEELYDLRNDPDEVKNLANADNAPAALMRLRTAHRAHALAIRDVGFLPEDEIHLQAALKTPYEMGHDAKKYPLERILDLAEDATLISRATLKAMDGVKDEHPGVRYWAVRAIMHYGDTAVHDRRKDLHAALKDESPSVRVAAAEALGQLGGKDDLAPALKVLLAHADAKKNSLYVSLAALNAIDYLGDKARPIAAEIRKLPTEPTDAKHRAAMGVSRLLTSIKSKLGQ
jgi:uncharacterized sulfatase